MSHVNTTAHYNLPIYGGNDIINPLTDVNGTNEALDTAIYEVAQTLASGVTDITDIKNKIGDASLDTASQTLSGAINELKGVNDAQTGDITDIGANVGTLQTQMATTTGNITTLNTTVAGLQTEVSGKASQTAVNTLATKVGTDALITTADNLSGAVNEIANDVDALKPTRTPDVTITADGVKNARQLFTELADAIDLSKLTPFSVVNCLMSNFDNVGCNIHIYQSGEIFWSYCRNFILTDNNLAVQIHTCSARKSTSGNLSSYIVGDIRNGNAFCTDNSTTFVPTAGSKFEIYY